jgi:hypothetical protein
VVVYIDDHSLKAGELVENVSEQFIFGEVIFIHIHVVSKHMRTPNIYFIHILQVINTYVHFSNVENESMPFIHTFDVQKLTQPERGRSEKYMKRIAEKCVGKHLVCNIDFVLCIDLC